MKRFAVRVSPCSSHCCACTACVSAPGSQHARRRGRRPLAVPVGPDGGAPIAERGIGGTGGPATTGDRASAAPGPPPYGLGHAGIGGTGMTGIVTGFASVCVDGLEVRWTYRAVGRHRRHASQPDRAARGPTGLAIKADPDPNRRWSPTLSVRHAGLLPGRGGAQRRSGFDRRGRPACSRAWKVGSLLVQPGAWVAVGAACGGRTRHSSPAASIPAHLGWFCAWPASGGDGEASIGSLAIDSRRDTKAEAGDLCHRVRQSYCSTVR